MNMLLKNARKQQKLKVREVAQLLGVDQALVSKFESGTRKPTKEQMLKLASILNLDEEQLLVAWLKEKILYEIGQDMYALKALQLAEEEVKYNLEHKKKAISQELETLLITIDNLKKKLDSFRKLDSYRIAEALELEYTFQSNRIEGNTLTLKETDLVINEGVTISGKSLREHLEAINHKEAVGYIKHLVEQKGSISERELLSIHNLILRGIIPEDAGKYRRVQVMIKGSAHLPPQPFLVPKQMEDYFLWYFENKNRLHPVVLAAEIHQKLVTIHPFIDGNGRTSRLLMNLVLLQHGYVIANIKGDHENRLAYYEALEASQTSGNHEQFLVFIAKTEIESLERYISILSNV